MVNKVKQTIAGLYALHADKLMKKAAVNNRSANYYSQFSGQMKRQNQGSTYGGTAMALSKKATRQTNRANRQYAKADKLMGY